MSLRNPGSPEARANGCRCSQSTNRDGDGAYTSYGGDVVYAIEKKCPLHGDEKYRKDAA